MGKTTMRALYPTLLDYDAGLLAIIAHRWDVDLETGDKRTDAQTLAEAMLEPERAAAEWERLSDAERGALQTLLAAPEHKMPQAQFCRLFGEIRQMGPERRKREKPHLQPVGVAEVLYYRGLVAQAFDQGKTGVQAFVYVPPDLAEVLPVHATGYALSEAPEPALAPEDDAYTPQQVAQATTALVDDLTTLLAYLQIADVPADPAIARAEVAEALAEHWLAERSAAEVALLLGVTLDLGVAAPRADGLLKPVPPRARRWLESTRPRQVRALAEAWRTGVHFNALWHTPGLLPEDTGWANDPLLARQTVLTYLELAPPDAWWPADELVALIKQEEPDFQRPGGDYASWYIRDAETGEYLRGFESWDRVEGAMLRFILTGPMHWLGLVDVGDGGALCRLTAYGRALLGELAWPDPREERPHLHIEPDGTLHAPRTMSRYERFQVARIATWEKPGDPYIYRLTANSLQRAAEQGLQTDAIRAFLRRLSGQDTLPGSVQKLLERWQRTGGADVWMTRAIVLRTTAPDVMQAILEAPELRRFVGAQLGPTAVLVLAGQERALAAALHKAGLLVEFDDWYNA